MTVPAAWRSRIVRHADVAPTDLAAHPSNFRRHPKHQAAALAEVLDDVGYVQSVVVNERSGRILDGHLRVELAVERSEPTIPVVYVDLADDEERLVLATFDPLGALAETNAERLGGLLADVRVSSDALAELLDGLRSSITPTLPTPSEQREPELKSECLIEIRCTAAIRDELVPMLEPWSGRDGFALDVS